jgi:putative ABC transport system permease protein
VTSQSSSTPSERAPREPRKRERRWVLIMAWRDARAGRARLALFATTVMVGVAALVAISGFSATLEDAVVREAKTLLGADLVISRQQPWDAEDQAWLQPLQAETLRRVRLSSMAVFPRTGESRLVEVVAVEPGYPFYGELVTEPPAAVSSLGVPGDALIDRTLMLQYDLAPGDEIRLGQATFRIAGGLVRVPGEAPAAALVAPPVFVPLSQLDATGLLAFGSRASFSLLLRTARSQPELDDWLAANREELRARSARAETAARRQERIGRMLDDLYRFLHLGALAALLLGALGVASAIHLHVQRKLSLVAVLRCLGVPPRVAPRIYLAQATAIGLAGSLAGAALGVAIQVALPLALEPFLPLQVGFSWQPLAIGQGVLTGSLVAVLFALPPLLSLRRVPPLLALRATALHEGLGRGGTPALVHGLLAAGVVAAAMLQTRDALTGLAISAALGVVLAALWGLARTMRAVARRVISASWPYPWRQGVANLYRPGNQTLVVLVGLGFGAFVLMTLYVSQATLLGGVQTLSRENRADLLLFDVQSDQVEGVREVLRETQVEVDQQFPIVPMRLRSLRGVMADTIDDPKIPRWALRMEYRVTYGATLRPIEEIVAGAWEPQGSPIGSGSPAPISLERELAETLQVGLGDELVFDLQGVEVPTRITSLRQVDWEEAQPNFFVLFPAGVLEDAPQQTVFVGWAGTPERSAIAQRRLVERFPNVSVVDLGTILRTIESVLDKVRFAVRFLAGFALAAGLAVLVVSLSLSALQRRRESVLLRTLGASRPQLRRIALVEFAALGGLAAAAAAVLATGAGWALARWGFDAELVVPWRGLAAVAAGLTAATVVIGLLASRRTVRRPPLEVLRAEG